MLDEENMARLKPKMKKIGGTIMSDGWQSTTSRPIINVILIINVIPSEVIGPVPCNGQ